MADSLDPENAAFWLPSSFLTDDDDVIKVDKDDCLFNSVDSSVSSTETERGGDSYCSNDELVAELTRHLDKGWNFSTSPQSTLSGFGPFTTRSGFSSNGSPNGPSSRVPSPPLTPPGKNDAAWELLYEAAGQVARLKINALAAELNNHHNNHQNHRFNHHHQQQPNRGLLGVPRNVSFTSKPLYDFPQYDQVKRQTNGGNLYCHHHNHHNHHNGNQQRRGCTSGPPLGLPNTSWPPLRPNHNHNHNPHQRQSLNGPGMRSIFLNGPGPGPTIKRQSTGTGVFLPRRAGTVTDTQPPQQQPEPRKRPTGCPSMWLPARVMDGLNMEFDEVNNGVNVNPRVRFSAGMLSEQEMIMARRNAVMEQQRRSLMRNDEIRLPSDWTY